MNLFKNILGRLFAFWALLVFGGTMLLIWIPVAAAGFWPEPKRSVIVYKIFAVWSHVFFFLFGVRRAVKGRTHFQKGQNYIVVCNHNSFMDVPLTTPAIPGPNKTIAKIEMASMPLFGIIYKRGSVLVDRKSEESRKASFAKMKEILAVGLHMCIYPEGTRNRTGEPLQKFHDGAFRLAIDTEKPIIPSLIFGTAKVMPHNKSFYFWPRRVEMHFLSPVLPAGKSVQELKDEVFDIMQAYYVQHRR